MNDVTINQNIVMPAAKNRHIFGKSEDFGPAELSFVSAMPRNEISPTMADTQFPTD